TLFEKAGSEFNQIKLNNIKIVALNPFYDLALLKIEDKTEKPLTKCYFSKSISWKKGESVFAIGNPYGLTRSISQGIISDKDRYVNGLIYIQTTAPINAGNSGGPLFDMRGDVIGVINMAYFRSDGIGFGIPLNYIYDFLTNVEAYSFDKDNPNSGFMYNRPPRRRSFDNIAE
ncbi:MAG TPA: trypsin-like peptidase domain-containing protein, partial [Candidatus Wallbacteria bacterium]|nr:trypsin-like peptidase domain-containing protein [Candidatus Wallbacteria bacterium]